MTDTWFDRSSLPEDDLRPGTLRRSLEVGSIRLMFISYDDASVAPPHRHGHTSVLWVESGRLEATVGDETRTLTEGDGAVIGPDVVHGLRTDGPARIVEFWLEPEDG